MAPPERHREASEARPLGGWEPFRALEDLQSQMGPLMESVLVPLGAINGARGPVAEIEETEDAWIVVAQLPGVEGKDVNIALRDSALWISGEIEESQRTGILRRRTRRARRFEFGVPLPGEVEADKIEAKLNTGVLTLRLPKAEHARLHGSEVKEEQA